MKAIAKYIKVEGGFGRSVKVNGIPVDYQYEVKLYAVSGDKVLGEISPAAKWIKEGDEIEVEVIESDWLKDKNGEFSTWVKVKCPCCDSAISNSNYFQK